MRDGRDQDLVRSSQTRKLEPRLQGLLRTYQKLENVHHGNTTNTFWLIKKNIYWLLWIIYIYISFKSLAKSFFFSRCRDATWWPRRPSLGATWLSTIRTRSRHFLQPGTRSGERAFVKKWKWSKYLKIIESNVRREKRVEVQWVGHPCPDHFQ